MSLKKNDIIQVRIDTLGCNGEGVARHGDTVIFVAGALAGERISAKILKVNTGYAFARLEKILEPSACRVLPPCKAYSRCGGCSLQHMDYQTELELKRTMVQDALKKYARVEIEVDKTVPSVEYGYRNKVQLPIGEKNGKIVAGFYRAGSNDIVEIEDCLLQPKFFATLLRLFKQYMEKNHLRAGRTDGDVRHLTARETQDTLLVAVVSPKATLKGIEEFYNSLVAAIDKRVGLYINVNKTDNNVIFGDRFVHVAGERYATTSLFGITAPVHPASFLQVNDRIRDALYADLLSAASGYDTIIDAYCGAGLLTALLAKQAEKVTGIEIVPQAVADANALLASNGITNASLYEGDCAAVLPSLLSKLNKKERVAIVLDPPRKGCSQAVTAAVNASGADTIFYISCNPATLARDIARLPNYTVTRATPYDMFPKTANIETLVVATRKNNA